MKYTVIHVWTNKCSNIKYNPNDTSSYWGLGDLIRGTIKLFQLQRYLKFNLVVDISLHPISHFIENTNTDNKYLQFINKNKNNIPYFYIDKLKPYLLEALDKSLAKTLLSISDNNIDIVLDANNNICEKIILLTTNDKNIETLLITDECKIFIKNIFKQKLEFQYYYENIINNFPNNYKEKKYSILHIRLGDNYLVKNDADDTIVFETLINKFITTNALKTNEDIIITDNKSLKNYIKNHNDLFTLDTIIAHTGINSEKEIIRDTLLEFFLLQNAKEIKTFSVYDWISGFVCWIAKIYDIPLLSIKNK
jgi:hypothetical protein